MSFERILSQAVLFPALVVIIIKKVMENLLLDLSSESDSDADWESEVLLYDLSKKERNLIGKAITWKKGKVMANLI